MKIAYLGPAGTFTEDALREAAAGRRLRAAADRDRPRRDPRRRARRGRAGAGPLRELDRGLGAHAPSTRSPSTPSEVTIVGEHDFAVRAHLIAREPLELERDRGGPLPSPAPRPVRPLPARAAAGGRAAQRRSTAEAVRMVSESSRAAGRRSAPAPRPTSTAARSCARGSRTRPTTSPASSGSRPAGTEPRGRRRVEDLAGLLRARRGPPGRAGRRAARVLQPRRQPDPDRVAAAAPGPRPLHVLLRPRGRRSRTRPVAEAIEALRGEGRIGAGPRLLPGRLSLPSAGAARRA